jgi:hypothetical protein
MRPRRTLGNGAPLAAAATVVVVVVVATVVVAVATAAPKSPRKAQRKAPVYI